MAIYTRAVQILRNCLSYALCPLLAILLIIPLVVIFLVAPERYTSQRGPVFWILDIVYCTLTLVFLMPRKWYNANRIPDEPAIIVANHQSSLDIPVVGALMRGAPHIWYALSDYTKHPFYGIFLRRIGISVYAHKSGASARGLLYGLRMLRDDPRHVIVFPEGGRYTDGSIHEFYRGFAVLARQTGRPVVPIYMPNNGAIFGPDDYLTTYHPIVAKVGQSFYLQEEETDEQFVQRVRDWFIQQAE